MKRMQSALLLLLIVIPSLSFAKKQLSDLQNDPIAKGMPIIFHRCLGSGAQQAHIGIMIQSMKTGKILYQRHANQLFTPASVQKMLTATAALNYLKPSFTFRTELLTRGKIVRHTLEGNLFIKFTGDPELTSKQLKKLIHQLHQHGIQRITGRIYIDATAYGNVPYPPGWIWDDLSYSFAAPLMTTIINHNYFTLTLKTPGSKKRHPLIETDLPMNIASFTNELTVVNSPQKNCPIGIYSHCHNHYVLRGCYYRRWKQQIRQIAIRDMPRYATVLVHDFLATDHIRYRGSIAFKPSPKSAHIIAQHFSPPLKKIVKRMLKESDNLTTDSLLKKLGETYFQDRGTWQNSLRALKKLLKPSGVNFKKTLINDGAGLSRYNLLSPKQLSKILYYAYHNKRVRRPFIQSLPIAGRDGTLEYRMQDLGKGGRVHAKTGSMTGVTALAGFIRTKHIGTISLVIMVNGFVKPRKPYITYENNVCRYLVSVRNNG